MNSISSWIANVDFNTIISEQDVRSKIALPLLSFLGYSNAVQANEFPIFSFSGRTKKPAKLVDLLCFSSEDWSKHRKFESRGWVKDNALLSFELKKPSEKLDNAIGQAEFYSMNARTPFYMCTNGKDIKIFEMKDFYTDKIIYDGLVKNIGKKWNFIYSQISFTSLLPLKKVIDEKKERIYLDYCISVKKQYEIIYPWYWEQTVISLQTKKKIALEEIITTTNSTALIGKAGTGKTTYLHRIFIKMCENYIKGNSEIIPVLLPAKLWKRDFSTLIEGILSELQVFLPHLTTEILENDIICKKICLLVDGIDECFIDRDILLREISNFSCKSIISAREGVVNGRIMNFNYYKLQTLQESELVKISSNILNKNTNLQIHKMKRELKELLGTSIYFKMWLTYNLEKREKKENNTINISQLYQSFTSYLLKNHTTTKGNFDVNNIPINSLQSILSKFAYDLYERNNPDIVRSIKEIYPTSIQTIYKIFLQSGLIFETSDQCEFQQHSLKEYYYANYVLTNKEYLDEFLRTKCNFSEYEEIFMILVGLTKDFKTQENILNYLLKHNFSLFIKCLYRRFDFSEQFEKNKNKIFYENFFATITQTYSEIIDLYFLNIRKHFVPFCWEQNYSKEMGIFFKCNVDVNSNSIRLTLSTTNDKKISTKITYSNNSTKMIKKKNNTDIEIPFGSLKGSLGIFQYNLNTMESGIDYAREIAVDMIYYNNKSILKEKRLLIDEPSLMQFSYIETWLKKASPIQIKFDNEIKKYNLSFKNQSVDELLSLLQGISSYTINSGRTQNKNITFGMLWYLIDINKNHTADIDKILFPDMLTTPIGKNRLIWNYYTYENIIKWIKNYYYYGQITYRKFVNKLLPNLANSLSYYETGPIRYNIVIELPDRNSNNFSSGGSLVIRSNLVNSIEDSDPLISVSDGSKVGKDFDLYYEERKKEANFFNRKLTYYSTSNCALTYVFNSDNSVREFVYKQLQEDFKKLFKP